ncbi:NUDIX hydrolase [Streptomyces albogriseolus]
MTTPAAVELQPLAPLARTIADAVRDTPVRLGTPEGAADLVAALTVKVAAYVGSELPATPGLARHMVEVDTERQRQLAKWGDQHHPDGTGWQRFGATAQHWKDTCDEAHANGTTTWAPILLEEVFEAMEEDDPVKLRTELVQCAAVIQAWISDIDSRTGHAS